MFIDIPVMAVSTLPEQARILQLTYRCGEPAAATAVDHEEAAAEHMHKPVL
jgi:hypothetical protein